MNKLYETENKPYPLNQNFEWWIKLLLCCL